MAAGTTCARLAALAARRRIAITAKLGFMGEALWNNNRITRIQNEIERKVALQRLLVLHRNLLLLAAFEAQNVIFFALAYGFNPPPVAMACSSVMPGVISIGPVWPISPIRYTFLLFIWFRMTVTFGSCTYFLSLAVISSANCSGVLPEAWTSPRSGIEIIPSGRTSMLLDSVGSLNTLTASTSDAPIT